MYGVIQKSCHENQCRSLGNRKVRREKKYEDVVQRLIRSNQVVKNAFFPSASPRVFLLSQGMSEIFKIIEASPY